MELRSSTVVVDVACPPQPGGRRGVVSRVPRGQRPVVGRTPRDSLRAGLDPGGGSFSSALSSILVPFRSTTTATTTAYDGTPIVHRSRRRSRQPSSPRTTADRRRTPRDSLRPGLESGRGSFSSALSSILVPFRSTTTPTTTVYDGTPFVHRSRRRSRQPSSPRTTAGRRRTVRPSLHLLIFEPARCCPLLFSVRRLRLFGGPSRRGRASRPKNLRNLRNLRTIRSPDNTKIP